MEQLLEGKVALVTGSAHGLGRRIADLFRQSGAVGLGVDQAQTNEASPKDWLFF